MKDFDCIGDCSLNFGGPDLSVVREDLTTEDTEDHGGSRRFFTPMRIGLYDDTETIKRFDAARTIGGPIPPWSSVLSVVKPYGVNQALRPLWRDS